MDFPVDISQTVLETKRMRLRPWREEDVQDFYEYAREDGVGQMAGWAPHRSLEESREILALFIREKKTFALELKETGQAIGSIGLEIVKELPEDKYALLRGREIGYVLKKSFWGRGLMPEAVQRVIQYCFEELGMDFLACGHFEWNSQSRRVIEKCGFAYCKTYDYTTRMDTVEKCLLYVLRNPQNHGPMINDTREVQR